MIILFFLLVLLSFNCASCNYPSDCILFLNHYYYNLCPFSSAPPTNFTVDSLLFSFNLGQESLQSCYKKKPIWGIAFNLQGECYDFDSPSVIQKESKLLKFHGEGLIISSRSTKLNSNSINLQLTLLCDSDADEDNTTLVINVDSIEQVETITYLNVSSLTSFGCAVASSNRILDFLEENKAFFIPPIIFLGIFYCFFGLKFFDFIIYTTSIGASLIFLGILIEEVADFVPSRLIILIVLGLLILADPVFSPMMKNSHRSRYIVVGTAFGAVAGFILYDTMLAPILSAKQRNPIFYMILAFCSLSAAGTAAWIQKDGFIIFTGFIGAFLIVRPISMVFGGFPSEIAVSSGLQEFDMTTFGYLIAILAIAAIGIQRQYAYYKRILKAEKTQDYMIEYTQYMQLI